MTTLLQQLQSRISLRRNMLAQFEEYKPVYKTLWNWPSYKAQNKLLADSQKLDKKIYQELLLLQDLKDGLWSYDAIDGA